MDITGIWHIIEMEKWDEDYLNMEVRAFIRIERKGEGEFRFGLVQGGIVGRMEDHIRGKRFEFTFDGCDENDEVSGRGWIELTGKDSITGEFVFQNGDSSRFKAERRVVNRMD